MTTIRCRDTVFSTTDFDNCVNELRANQASFQAPLHVTIPRSRRFGVPQIRVHELVAEFDEARSTRAAVVAILAKYGCHEGVQSSDGPCGGPVPSSPLPNFVCDYHADEVAPQAAERQDRGRRLGPRAGGLFWASRSPLIFSNLALFWIGPIGVPCGRVNDTEYGLGGSAWSADCDWHLKWRPGSTPAPSG